MNSKSVISIIIAAVVIIIYLMVDIIGGGMLLRYSEAEPDVTVNTEMTLLIESANNQYKISVCKLANPDCSNIIDTKMDVYLELVRDNFSQASAPLSRQGRLLIAVTNERPYFGRNTKWKENSRASTALIQYESDLGILDSIVLFGRDMKSPIAPPNNYPSEIKTGNEIIHALAGKQNEYLVRVIREQGANPISNSDRIGLIKTIEQAILEEVKK